MPQQLLDAVSEHSPQSLRADSRGSQQTKAESLVQKEVSCKALMKKLRTRVWLSHYKKTMEKSDMTELFENFNKSHLRDTVSLNVFMWDNQ